MVDFIKQKCKEKGISLSKLERECELGPNTIYRWDSSPASVDKVLRVADALDVSMDEICGRSFDDQTLAGLYEFAREMNTLSEQENLLVLSFRTLSDADKLAIMSLILKMRLKKEDE